MLTKERLKELLRYDPETGSFTRVVNARRDGKVGSTRRDGYIGLCVDGTIYTAHRLAFLYMTGEWPKHDVDHIDGDQANNRWDNLRDEPTIVNCQNRTRPQKNSANDCLGVGRAGNNWRARITVNDKTIHLGCFRSKEDASAAYIAAKRRLHSGCTI